MCIRGEDPVRGCSAGPELCRNPVKVPSIPCDAELSSPHTAKNKHKQNFGARVEVTLAPELDLDVSFILAAL